MQMHERQNFNGQNMNITAIRAIPLYGSTPDGGWTHDFDPENNLHTLIEVVTDEKMDGKTLTGIGSVYTSGALVEGALQLLRPWCIGAERHRAGAGEREAAAKQFWQGRGGGVEHAISGIDIALWDLLGKALGQPVVGCWAATTATGSSRTARSCSTSRRRCARRCCKPLARGFKAIKMGWRPFGRVSRQVRRATGPDGPRHGRRRTSS